MAKLYFYYASMNAGKSTMLLQADFNYRERGMRTMLFTASMHDRDGHGVIGSRIGLQAGANIFTPDTDLRAEVEAEHDRGKLSCVLVDEAQFGIPVLAYGLRTDFAGNLFEGSGALLGLADALTEIKAICRCGRKATMNLRVDAEGRAVVEGAQTEIGGNDRYVAMCRRHFMAKRREAAGVLADA